MSMVISEMRLDTPLHEYGEDLVSHLKCYRVMLDGLEHHAIVARENISRVAGVQDYRWHLSIKAADGVPTWRALSQIAHALRPGVNLVSAVPSEAHWINVHPSVLHLFEIKDPALETQWREEGRGDRPT